MSFLTFGTTLIGMNVYNNITSSDLFGVQLHEFHKFHSDGLCIIISPGPWAAQGNQSSIRCDGRNDRIGFAKSKSRLTVESSVLSGAVHLKIVYSTSLTPLPSPC